MWVDHFTTGFSSWPTADGRQELLPLAKLSPCARQRLKLLLLHRRLREAKARKSTHESSGLGGTRGLVGLENSGDSLARFLYASVAKAMPFFFSFFSSGGGNLEVASRAKTCFGGFVGGSESAHELLAGDLRLSGTCQCFGSLVVEAANRQVPQRFFRVFGGFFRGWVSFRQRSSFLEARSRVSGNTLVREP